MPAPRWRPTASISSMKMMQGEFCLACSKRSRTRLAPTPTNISTKSEPEIEKNGHAGLTGDGAREQGLTRAGRPVEQDALGNPGAERLELLRVLEELLDLVQLLDGLVGPGDVAEGDLRRVDRHPLRARLAEAHHARAAALHLVHQEEPEPEEEDEREDVGEDREEARAARALDLGLDVLAVELVDERRPGGRADSRSSTRRRSVSLTLSGLGLLLERDRARSTSAGSRSGCAELVEGRRRLRARRG